MLNNTIYALNLDYTIACKLYLQPDGNLVMTDGSGNLLWHRSQYANPNNNAAYFMNGTGQFSVPLVATTSANGYMSASDKYKLDRLGYTQLYTLDNISRNAQVSGIAGATIYVVRCEANSGFLCIEINGLSISTQMASGASLIGISVAGGGQPLGDHYITPIISSTGVPASFGLYVQTSGSHDNYALIRVLGTAPIGTYNFSAVVPVSIYH